MAFEPEQYELSLANSKLEGCSCTSQDVGKSLTAGLLLANTYKLRYDRPIQKASLQLLQSHETYTFESPYYYSKLLKLVFSFYYIYRFHYG